MRTDNEELTLVADVGGTNARFALVAPGGHPEARQVLSVTDFPTLEDAVACYLDGQRERPRRAAIAIATPITGDEVSMTNHRWSFSVAAARARLGFAELRVLNDFTALALAVPCLEEDDVRRVGGGEPVAGTPIALIGPGTGLGVSGLIPDGARYIPLQSEGGHVTYGAGSHRESAILSVIGRRYNHISAERLMSGPGLVNLYKAIAEVDGLAAEPLLPEQITERALAGESPLCAEVLRTFCAMLGTAAGNLVLTLGARAGVYIGGGIVPQLGDYFETSPFRAEFERRGRFSAYLAAVPAYVIHADQPALMGAAAAFKYPAREVGAVSRV